MDALAVRIEQDLDLDVARTLDEPLQDQPVVPNAAAASRRAAASASGRRSRSRTVRMPLPPPPAAGLTSIGKPMRRASARSGVVGLVRFVVARDDRDAERRGQPSRRRLVAHRADRVGRRADPADAGSVRRPRRRRRSRRGTRSPGGRRRRRRHVRPRRRQRCRAGRGRRGRSSAGRSSRARAGRPCGGSGSRSRRGWRRTTAGSAALSREPVVSRPGRHAPTRQSRHPRHAIDRRPAVPAASRAAIQRWTVRVVVPSRAATWLGDSSSDIVSRSSHSRDPPARRGVRRRRR